MQLAFDAINITNFGSFVGRHELRLAASASALNLIRGRNKVDQRLGSNGAGKSTLLNALCWCLYGKTTNDLASTDIRPWHGKGQTKVSTSVFIDDSVQVVTRTTGPNSLTIGTKPVLQPEIDRLLGMSFDVFRQTVLLGQNRPLFHDLPNREKLQFLSDVLDLERWDRYSTKAAGLASGLEDKQAEFERDRQKHEGIAESLAGQVTKQQDESDAWAKDRASKLKAAEKALKIKTKSAADITTKLGYLSSKLDLEEYQLGLLDTDLAKLQGNHTRVSIKLSEMRSTHASLGKLRDEAEATLKSLLTERSCPACGQPIKEQAQFLENKAKLETTINKYLKEASALDLKELEQELNKISVQLSDTTNARAKAAKGVIQLEQERDLLANTKSHEDFFLKLAQREVDELSTAGNPFQPRLNDLRKHQAEAVSRATEAKDQVNKLEAKITRRRFWVKAFKDIRLFVLQEALQDLEVVTNSMLDSIGLAGWEVGYAIERETKSGTIQKGLITTVRSPGLKDGQAVKWASWSGGESQRIRLVGSLALSEVLLARAGVECNIEILDEPTKGLSTEGVEDLCEFLSERSRKLGRTIWLVDHKTLESSLFDNVVTVTKTKAGSALSQGGKE